MLTSIPPELACRPFTLGEARTAGLTRDHLKGARFTRLYPSVYAVADLLVDPVMRVRAAQLAVEPFCAASYETGLALHGIGDVDVDLVHLSTRHPHPCRIPGIEMHRHFNLGPWSDLQGSRVLCPERCLIDAATNLGLADVVAAGDGLVALNRTTIDRLDEFVHSHHYDGIVRARRAVELMAVGSESFRESHLRVMLVLAGLPTPRCNTSYGDETGIFTRLDLSYEQWKVAVEYDGRQHGLALAQRERDVRRPEAMERLGWVFIVVTAAQLGRTRDIVKRVHGVLVSRGYSGSAPSFSGEWLRTFEPLVRLEPRPRNVR